RREARAAARLHHTNIVPVHGVGECEGVHYYAMQFISGQGLDEVLKEVRRLRHQKEPPSAETPGPGAGGSRSLARGLLSGQFSGVGTSDQEVRESEPRVLASGEPAPLPYGRGSEASPTSAGSASGSELTAQPEAQYFRSVAQMGAQVAEALDYAHK